MRKHKIRYIISGVIVLVLVIGGLYLYKNSDQQSEGDYTHAKIVTDSTDSSVDDTDESDSESNSSNQSSIEFDGVAFGIGDSQIYNPDFSDNSWGNTKVDIDSVKVVRTDEPTENAKGDTINGIVGVHYSITAGRDINIFPTQGTLSTNTGEQVSADMQSSDSFEAVLDEDSTAEGYVVYYLQNLDDINDLKNIRVKWRAYYDTKDYNDNDSHHNYDESLQLE